MGKSTLKLQLVHFPPRCWLEASSKAPEDEFFCQQAAKLLYQRFRLRIWLLLETITPVHRKESKAPRHSILGICNYKFDQQILRGAFLLQPLDLSQWCGKASYPCKYLPSTCWLQVYISSTNECRWPRNRSYIMIYLLLAIISSSINFLLGKTFTEPFFEIEIIWFRFASENGCQSLESCLSCMVGFGAEGTSADIKATAFVCTSLLALLIGTYFAGPDALRPINLYVK